MSIYLNLRPTGKFLDVPADEIKYRVGVLTTWISNAWFYVDQLKYLNEVYPHGIHEMTGGALESDGVFKFPEDPDMHPLASLKCDGENIAYFYQYEMVAILIKKPTGNEFFVTRMDR